MNAALAAAVAASGSDNCSRAAALAAAGKAVKRQGGAAEAAGQHSRQQHCVCAHTHTLAVLHRRRMCTYALEHSACAHMRPVTCAAALTLMCALCSMHACKRSSQHACSSVVAVHMRRGCQLTKHA